MIKIVTNVHISVDLNGKTMIFVFSGVKFDQLSDKKNVIVHNNPVTKSP